MFTSNIYIELYMLPWQKILRYKIILIRNTSKNYPVTILIMAQQFR